MFCGKCAQHCPMGAITVDTGQKKHDRLARRCIGCALCALACDRQRALRMEPVPDYRLPYRSWFSLAAHAAPGFLRTSWRVWRKR
jgi:Fe-S-cluster-containing hydrogenase component 2